MSDRDANSSGSGPPRCRHCHDVIGVYEPIVVAAAGGVLTTSIAVDPEVYDTRQPCFHHACYAELHGDGE